MVQATKAYKRTVAGSIGAGIGSVFGRNGKTYFILEHKQSSKYHRAGETQEIIVDQIELGRDAKCQVRFDDSFSTVSRRHAAIMREGDRWKLVQLSATNSTLLNGQRIDRESYLQNGDEIKLSSDGPVLGFIVPTGKKATVGSIGLTRRLTLFRQQALKPYKTALWILSIILLLVIVGGFWWGASISEKLRKQLNEEREKLVELILENQNDKSKVDSLSNLLSVITQKQAELSSKSGRIGGNYVPPVISTPKPEKTAEPSNELSKTPSVSNDLAACNQYVYAIFLNEMYCVLPSGEEQFRIEKRFVGSGFMLNDGRFITARHVIEPWYYYPYFEERDAKIAYKLYNYCSFNMGKVYAKYTIVSPAGKRYSFTNEQIICNRANDRTTKEDEDFMTEGLSLPGPAIYTTAANDRYDWAYYQTNSSDGLKVDNAYSENIPQGTQLDILGYPRSFFGTYDIYEIENSQPMYANCITSGNGLNTNGLILSSNTDPTGGNSGSPVLIQKDGGYVVIGLVSGQIQQKGVIVPISEVRK